MTATYVTIRFAGGTSLIRIPVTEGEEAYVQSVTISGWEWKGLPALVLRPGEELVIRCHRADDDGILSTNAPLWKE